MLIIALVAAGNCVLLCIITCICCKCTKRTDKAIQEKLDEENGIKKRPKWKDPNEPE